MADWLKIIVLPQTVSAAQKIILQYKSLFAQFWISHRLGLFPLAIGFGRIVTFVNN
jgi:hypothetical protein